MNYQPDVKKIYNQLKQSAKKRNIPFELTILDLYDLSYPVTCPILGIPLKYNRGKAEDNSYSIDRKDNAVGYTKENIVVISLKANKLKSNATNEELKKLSEFYDEPVQIVKSSSDANQVNGWIEFNSSIITVDKS